jgi:hypothetical protein
MCEKRLNGLNSLRRFLVFKTGYKMNSILGILFVFSVWFMVFMFRKTQNRRINESSRYEEHVRDRRETRRRARSRKREEEKQKNEKNTEGVKFDT